MSTYIGLCCSAHDSAIAIIDKTGKIVFAEAGERSLQIKRALNCIPDHYPFISKLTNKYVDLSSDVLISKNWSSNHQRNIKMAKIGIDIIKPILFLSPLAEITRKYEFMLSLQNHMFSFSGQNLKRVLEQKKEGYILIKERNFDHHLCHASAGFYSSPFSNADIAVIDGYGEMTSTAFFSANDNKLKKIKSIPDSKNSLGFFYSYLCKACGFDPDMGEEWKVMGLAPYGRLNPKLYESLSKLLPVKKGAFTKPYLTFDIADYDRLISESLQNDEIKPEDIAFTGQKIFEDKMFLCLNELHAQTNSKNLVLVGGAALNSSCNGKIIQNTAYQNFFVYNAPGDDGTAVGAAILAFLSENHVSKLQRNLLSSPYLGNTISKNKLQKLTKNTPYNYDLKSNSEVILALLISRGYIVGLVRGKSEFGPRSLGHRSILADPRDSKIKDVINKKLKYRENFRPFAPSILHEYGPQIFENYEYSPYMERTLKIRQEFQKKIPGVTHINGTGRLQSVTRENSPDYYKLIQEFYKITGIPVLLNTSFNVAGKPIINDVDDICAALYTTGLDAILIENILLTKKPIQNYLDEKFNCDLL
ncbi:carbamoyltransferase [Zobellia nedashkovskayae]|uniref:carbamoyltransferase family protein n=1 Tax=Zobellia nedashkovskayae TaxID=2779510 RepID=UPI00188CC527|nr:carbamoyltransferase C-terminal domain-containing protein [Zobellia nedashkovskayae]